MSHLSEFSETHFKAGSQLSSLVSASDRKRIMESLSVAKTGVPFSTRDTFGSVMTLIETKFSAELKAFKSAPAFQRFLRGYVVEPPQRCHLS